MDQNDGPKLHMFAFDGSPLNPQFLVSTTPNMLPTQLLYNVTPQPQAPFQSQNGFWDTGVNSSSKDAVNLASTNSGKRKSNVVFGIATLSSLVVGGGVMLLLAL